MAKGTRVANQVFHRTNQNSPTGFAYFGDLYCLLTVADRVGIFCDHFPKINIKYS